MFRHDSPVFRLTGYLPIFPIAFKEKADTMMHGSKPGTAPGGDKTIFRPGLKTIRAPVGELARPSNVRVRMPLL